MVFKSRHTKKYITSRRGKKGYWAVRHRKNFIPRALRMHQFVFNQSLGQIVSDTVAQYSDAINFKLSDITDSAHLAGLFDQYRITKVILEFIPRQTEMVVAQSTDAGAAGFATAIPMFASAIDLDSDNNPTAITDLREFSKYKEVPATKYVKWTLTPAVLQEVYRTTLTTSYSTKTNMWLDTAHNDVPHRGIKWFLEAGGSATGRFVYEIKSTYYLDLKSVR